MVNLVTSNGNNIRKYFNLVIGEKNLVDDIFEMCWSEYEQDEELDTTVHGENALTSFLIFIYNCSTGAAQATENT